MLGRRQFLASVGAATFAPGVLSAAEPGRDESPPVATRPAPNSDKPFEPARVIDVHLHLFNTNLQGTDGIPKYIAQDATVEAAIEAMDRGRIDKAFLISYAAEDVAVQIRKRGVDPDKIKTVVSKEYQVAAFKKFPERFWWFTDHLDPLRPSCLDDLKRDFDEGASGIKMLPWFHGVLPDHPTYVRVLESCRRHKKPVILDLSWWYFDLNPLDNEPPDRQKLVRSFADYARLLSPLFRQFADVPISLAHCGTAKTDEDYRAIFPLIAAHPNVSCDVAAATGYSAEFVGRLVNAVGAHKVMYGTDWPYWSNGIDSYVAGPRRWRMIAHECPGLTHDDKRRILADNAERFVRNELPDGARSRAEALHRKASVIVIHDHNPIPADVPRMRAGGVAAKVYQLGVDVEIGKDYLTTSAKRSGFRARARAALDEARQTIMADPQRLVLALSADDIERARQAGKIAILMGIEGGKFLEAELAVLAEFYKLGLREVQLRWAVPNQLVETDALTEFGREVVAECQHLGIIVDLTHIPEKAFFQTIELAKKPVIVSHGTGAELGEKRVRAIADRGGVVGIHFYTSYLGAKPNVLQVVDAVEDLVRLGGIEVAGLGVDFFPTEGAWGEFQRAQGTQDISWAVPDLSYIPEVTRALVARGFSDEQILAVLGGNFLRVCREALQTG